MKNAVMEKTFDQSLDLPITHVEKKDYKTFLEQRRH
jgi:hypothetical protein